PKTAQEDAKPACGDGVCSGSERCSTCPKDCGPCAGSDTTAPSAPSNFRVTEAQQSSIAVAWNASTDTVGVAAYETFRNVSKAGTPSQTTATYQGLTCGTTYQLGVRAFDAAGNRSTTAPLTTASAACSSTPSQIYWGAFIDGNDTYGGTYTDAPWDSNTWDL